MSENIYSAKYFFYIKILFKTTWPRGQEHMKTAQQQKKVLKQGKKACFPKLFQYKIDHWNRYHEDFLTFFYFEFIF